MFFGCLLVCIFVNLYLVFRSFVCVLFYTKICILTKMYQKKTAFSYFDVLEGKVEEHCTHGNLL